MLKQFTETMLRSLCYIYAETKLNSFASLLEVSRIGKHILLQPFECNNDNFCLGSRNKGLLTINFCPC